MGGRKKKSIEELETELEELIMNSGWSEDDIHANVNAYRALKKRIGLDDDDIWQMKDLHNAYLLGDAIRTRQKKINAARKVAATAAAVTAAAANAASNVSNTSISIYANSVESSTSTLINANKITASFESTPPSSNPSSTTLLPSSSDKSRASLGINSLSDQSSIIASHSINNITASFEANASFASSASHSNASTLSIVGAQSSKCLRLSSQHSDAVVNLLNKCSTWNPHQRLLLSNVIDIMDVPGDGSCLFYACISQLQNCTTFTIE
jgi:hypothetical protein